MASSPKKKKFEILEDSTSGLRLPLDLLLIHDVEDLEDSLSAKWVVESDGAITFHKTDYDLELFVEDLDEFKYYQLDDIEHDRIHAAIELLNKAEDDNFLDHILNRLVR